MNALSAKIKYNLNFLAEMHGLSEAELCRQINVSQPTLHRLLAGTTDDPRASTLASIASYFNVSVDQLLGLKPLPKTINKNVSVETATFIPMLAWEDTKDWVATDANHESKYRQWIETESSNKKCFGLEVVGESMWPQFSEGTILIVNPMLQPKNRDFVVCFLNKEQQTVCRQYLEEQNNKILKPINPVFFSTRLSRLDKIIGVVIQARNDLKKNQ